MLFPKNLEQKLGFDHIREWLNGHCTSTLGQDYVQNIRFSTDFRQVQKLLAQTQEFVDIIHSGEGFPQQSFLDPRNQLKKAVVENTFLESQELLNLSNSLKMIQVCVQFLNKRAELYPTLVALTRMVEVDKNIPENIDFAIDDKGQVRDTASSELHRIRRKLVSEQSTLRKKIEQALHEAKQKGYTASDLAPTIRSERLVIPVAAEFKRKIKGFIHDESASGQTAFIEPEEVFDQNNRVRELQYEERREVILILVQLTNLIRPHLSALQIAYKFLGMIDFIRAKARLAIDMEAVLPQMTKQPLINWQQARHPVLTVTLPKQGRQVVPFSLSLSQDNCMLIVSGPNAGGKSVLLKSVGLIQFMIQCGLLPPIFADSTIGVFNDIFVDIGDEQSIENDLSTYSSHLLAMREILRLADKRSLVLADEMGSGTEPSFGGAMAEAILEELYNNQVWTIATTHYTNLKFMAERLSGITNGAMRFDNDNLAPKYELETGQPGSSFAFEIAQKMRLPKHVIQSAQKKAGKQQVEFDGLLKELSGKKNFYEAEGTELANQRRRYDLAAAHYEQTKALLDKREKEIINEAKAQAKDLVQQANRRIEHTIKEIKESQAERESTRQARTELENYAQEHLQAEKLPDTARLEIEKDKMAAKEQKAQKNKKLLPIRKAERLKAIADAEAEKVSKIEPGGYVKIKDTGALAKIDSIKGNEAVVYIGSLKANIKLKRLEASTRKAYDLATKGNREEQPEVASTGFNFATQTAAFTSSVDLRGMRAEEAIPALEIWLDRAIVLNQKDLRVVHGKGNGILREVIRQQLRKYRQVSDIRDEHVELGGSGVTLFSVVD